MSLRIDIPITYEAVVLKKNGSRPKKMRFREDVEVDIPAFDMADAPIAVAWRDRSPQGQLREHFTRWLGGSHMAPAVGSPVGDEGKLRNYAVEYVNSKLLPATKAIQEECEIFDPSKYRIVDGRQRNKALFGVGHFAKRLVVLDDAMYARVQDPAYFVNRAHKQRKGGAWSYAIRPIEMASSSLTTRYFSLHDFDAVLEYSPGAAEKNGRYDVDVLIPDSLTIDPSEQDILHAGILTRGVANILIFTPEGAHPMRHRRYASAPEVLEPWHKLCLMLPPSYGGDFGFLPNYFDYDQLAEVLEDLHPYLLIDSLSHPRETLRTDLNYIREAMDMYRERPLDFTPSGMGM